MGASQFRQDVASASNAAIIHLQSVAEGTCDDEIVLMYAHPLLPSWLEILLLVRDIPSYPNRSSFVVSANSRCDKGLAACLQMLSSRMDRRTVHEAIVYIVDELDLAVAGGGTDNSDGVVSLNTGVLRYPSFLEYDEPTKVSDSSHRTRDDSHRVRDLGQAERRRLNQNLKQAQAAGLSAGVFEDHHRDTCCMFSFSCRASKLGVLEDALETWGLEPSDHVVLLLKTEGQYPTLDEFLASTPHPKNILQFRFGKCVSPKPAFASAMSAFDSSWGDTSCDYSTEKSYNAFLRIPMSDSINGLLNEKLAALLRYRRAGRIQWDTAMQMFRQANRGDDTGNLLVPRQAEDVMISEQVPSGFKPDYAMQPAHQFNIPLVSMQLALRHLVRCTEYCMACHRKIPNQTEALKPYVCSRKSCLSLLTATGIGACVEYEVVQHPYVVDVLVSFYYAGLNSSTPGGFPTGLTVQSDHLDYLAQRTFKCGAYVQFDILQINFDAIISVAEGTYFLLAFPDHACPPGGSEPYYCRIISKHGDTYFFETISTITSSPHTHQFPQGKVFVHVYTYDIEIDGLGDPNKYFVLTKLAATIPSVLEMRSWVLQNPHQKLCSWTRMSSAALGLLRWIVAFDGLHVIQDSALPSGKSPSSLSSPSGHGTVRVPGLGNDWMAFRLAKGRSKTTRNFDKALLARTEAVASSSPPTLFGWHGSLLGNWHSILRSGLNFQTIANGRTYGQGVYFSQNFDTSDSYSMPTNTLAGLVGAWPNSQLRVSKAIGLYEILNQPKQFRCIIPHYVVDKLDWIQCRHILVCVSPTKEARNTHLATSKVVHQRPLHQDRPLIGPINKTVQIDLAALPRNTRRLWLQAARVGGHDNAPEKSGHATEGNQAEVTAGGDDDIDALIPTGDLSRRSDHTRLGKRRRQAADGDSTKIIKDWQTNNGTGKKVRVKG